MGEARIIDGKKTAEELRAHVKNAVSVLKQSHNLTPGLSVVIVGDDPASHVYVNSKAKFSKEAGMNSAVHRLPEQTTQDELLKVVRDLNNDADVHGILVQLPLPDHIDSRIIIDAISPAKDVDGLHPVSAGNLVLGQDGFVPCTPLGCMILIKQVHENISGKDAVVIGRSHLVGKPVAQLLLNENCTVTIAHSRTQNIEDVARNADILVAAVGRPKMVKAEWIKPGATVIDVGINRIAAPEKGEGKTRLVGDVDYAAAKEVAGAITPVPKGVGPMTVACLLRNTVQAACFAAGVDLPEGL